MKRGILPNLDFEYELRGTAVPAAAASQRQRWSHVLRLVPGWEEATPIVGRGDAAFDEVLPWGASAPAGELAGAAAGAWPDSGVVRRCNDKRFSHELEVEFDVALPRARIVDDFAGLDDAVSKMPRWVAKHPFGVSGRDQLRGEGAMEAGARRGATRLLASGFGLVVEPLVHVTHEFSLHFDVSDDLVRFVGATALLTDGRGLFRGNVAPLLDVPAPVVETAGQAATRMRHLGYRGPVGVDALRGTVEGTALVRPIMEINARWTFGRLTLELVRRLGAEGVRWHHPSRARRAPGVPLPDDVDPGGQSGTSVELVEPVRWTRGGSEWPSSQTEVENPSESRHRIGEPLGPTPSEN